MIYLQITPLFPSPSSFRGSYVFDQVQTLREQFNLNVKVVRLIPFYSRARNYSIDGIEVYCLRKYDLPSSIAPGIFDRISCLALKHRLKRWGIKISDIKILHAHINTSSIYGTYLKSLNPGIFTITQHHGHDVFGLTNGVLRNSNLHQTFKIRYGRRIANAVDLHIGVSYTTIKSLKKYFDGISFNTYVLINGVNKEKFYRVKKNLNSERKFVIGCVGNFWTIKDQMTLLKAQVVLREMFNTNILIRFVGTGETRRVCEEYTKEMGLQDQVDFHGDYKHGELNDFYNQLDLFVLPSYDEALGCVYLESYSAGVPFIAVKNQGIEDFISDKTQWLIESGDYEDLARKIYRQVINPQGQTLTINIDIVHTIRNFLSYLYQLNVKI